MNFKFQTSGNGLDETPVFPFTLQGNSLKPLSPVNLRGTRNTNGDLLIEWTRRSRLGSGLRPFSDVPLAEETEVYEIEVYDGSTLKRTWRVTAQDSQPVIWSDIRQTETTPGDVTIAELSNGGLTYDDVSLTNGTGSAIGAQKIYGDTRLEITLGSLQFPSFIALSSGPFTNAQDAALGGAYWTHAAGDDTNVFTDSYAIAPYGGPEDFTAGDRFMIEISGGVVRYFKNRTQLSAPVFVSTIQPLTPPLRPIIAFDSNLTNAAFSTQGIASAMLQHAGAVAMYTLEQQEADFASAQSSVKVRVYQVSGVVGRGAYTEATI